MPAIMSNNVPLFFAADTSGSFSRTATASAGKDVRSLALLLLLTLVQLWSQRGLLRIPQLAAATACSGAVVAALACALTQPTVYRRRRQPIVAALRLLLAVSTLLSGSSLELFASAAAPAHAQTLLQALPHFLLLLAWESGALLLGQAAWSLELPPLLAMMVQLVGVAAVASRNSSTCASPYMQRPANRQLMGRVYALLQPAVAPLEPMLATVGLTAAYPSRPCICVLAVLQFWGAFFLPVLLTTRGQLRAYLEWRHERHGQQRAQRRNRSRMGAPPPLPPNVASTAAGAASGAAAAGSSPVSGSGSGNGNSSNKSSPISPHSGGSGGWFGLGRGLAGSNGSGSASSPRSSLSSDSVDEAAGLSAAPHIPSLAQLLKPPRRGGKPHPEDWQYEAAAKLMADLSPSWLQLVVVAVGLAQMYTWHTALFPASFN